MPHVGAAYKLNEDSQIESDNIGSMLFVERIKMAFAVFFYRESMKIAGIRGILRINMNLKEAALQKAARPVGEFFIIVRCPQLKSTKNITIVERGILL